MVLLKVKDDKEKKSKGVLLTVKDDKEKKLEKIKSGSVNSKRW